MPRHQKPPGREKWTWDEINAGRRMSKSEKRFNRLAVNLGATKTQRGEIVPPTYQESPQYYWAFGFLLVICLIVFIAAIAGK